MEIPRRQFLTGVASAAAGATVLPIAGSTLAADNNSVAAGAKSTFTAATVEALNQAAAEPVLGTERFKDPIINESVELLQKGKDHFVRVRTKDGAEGISVDNGRMDVLAPIFHKF